MLKNNFNKNIKKFVSTIISVNLLWHSVVWANPDIFSNFNVLPQTIFTNSARENTRESASLKYMLSGLEKIEKDPDNQNLFQTTKSINELIDKLRTLENTHDNNSALNAISLKYNEYYLEIIIGGYTIRYFIPNFPDCKNLNQTVQNPGDPDNVVQYKSIGRYLHKIVLENREPYENSLKMNKPLFSPLKHTTSPVTLEKKSDLPREKSMKPHPEVSCINKKEKNRNKKIFSPAKVLKKSMNFTVHKVEKTISGIFRFSRQNWKKFGFVFSLSFIGCPGTAWSHHFLRSGTLELTVIPDQWIFTNPKANTLSGIVEDILKVRGEQYDYSSIQTGIDSFLKMNPGIKNPDIILAKQEIAVPRSLLGESPQQTITSLTKESAVSTEETSLSDVSNTSVTETVPEIPSVSDIDKTVSAGETPPGDILDIGAAETVPETPRVSNIDNGKFWQKDQIGIETPPENQTFSIEFENYTNFYETSPFSTDTQSNLSPDLDGLHNFTQLISNNELITGIIVGIGIGIFIGGFLYKYKTEIKSAVHVAIDFLKKGKGSLLISYPALKAVELLDKLIIKITAEGKELFLQTKEKKGLFWACFFLCAFICWEITEHFIFPVVAAAKLHPIIGLILSIGITELSLSCYLFYRFIKGLWNIWRYKKQTPHFDIITSNYELINMNPDNAFKELEKIVHKKKLEGAKTVLNFIRENYVFKKCPNTEKWEIRSTTDVNKVFSGETIQDFTKLLEKKMNSKQSPFDTMRRKQKKRVLSYFLPQITKFLKTLNGLNPQKKPVEENFDHKLSCLLGFWGINTGLSSIVLGTWRSIASLEHGPLIISLMIALPFFGAGAFLFIGGTLVFLAEKGVIGSSKKLTNLLVSENKNEKQIWNYSGTDIKVYGIKEYIKKYHSEAESSFSNPSIGKKIAWTEHKKDGCIMVIDVPWFSRLPETWQNEILRHEYLHTLRASKLGIEYVNFTSDNTQEYYENMIIFFTQVMEKFLSVFPTKNRTVKRPTSKTKDQESIEPVKEKHDLLKDAKIPRKKESLDKESFYRKEKILTTEETFFKNFENTISELIHNMIRISVETAEKAPSGKIGLFLDMEIADMAGKPMDIEIKRVIRAICNIKNNNTELTRFLERLEIIRFEKEKFKTKKGNINPENMIIITKKSNLAFFNDVQDKALIGAFDDTATFRKNAYIPIPEVLVFLLGRYLKKDISTLLKYYKNIPNIIPLKQLTSDEYKNIFSEQMKHIIIKIAPNAVAFDTSEQTKIRAHMITIIKNA